MNGETTTKVVYLKNSGRLARGSERSLSYRTALNLKEKRIVRIIETKKPKGKNSSLKVHTAEIYPDKTETTNETEETTNGADIQPKTATDMDSGE